MKKELIELENKANAIKQALQDKIYNLPDNPNIKRLGGTGAFTITLSEISKSSNRGILSAQFYDFKAQYKSIVKSLNKVEPLKVYSYLENMCKERKLNNQPLHPGVISFVTSIIQNS